MLLVVLNDATAPLGSFEAHLHDQQRPFFLWKAAEEPLPIPLEDLEGVIVLGGQMGVHDEEQFPFLRRVKALLRELLLRQTPVLGICLGGQLLAEAAGAVVTSHSCGERGALSVELTAAATRDPLFSGLENPLPVYQWHDDSFALPAGADLLAASDRCPCQGFRLGKAWGLQFHPEISRHIMLSWCRDETSRSDFQAEFNVVEERLSETGRRLLANFLSVCTPV